MANAGTRSGRRFDALYRSSGAGPTPPRELGLQTERRDQAAADAAGARIDSAGVAASRQWRPFPAGNCHGHEQPASRL